MRASCEIIVRVDVAAAIAAGMVHACLQGGAGAGQERGGNAAGEWWVVGG